ncbi:MAG: Mrp/NBP35 family ATP-binding protein [Lachnospiraceae bacterium]|nr:Mrp/NBP35 family ATP-binding protein [Lachnospiraceae bacterium]
MASECNHDCNSCKSDCGERQQPQSMLAPTNEYSSIGNVIGIVSGKGGVGKTLVTSMLSVLSRRKGYETGILDADITGASIPKVFGCREMAVSDGQNLIPVVSKTGIKLMSANLLLEEEGQPVLWRGPLIAGMVKQFWSDVRWEYLDYMFVDMPPGTGDVPLTVFQSLPVKGIIIVTSPQELVSMIVEKAVHMAEMMHVPILGIVENMSYFECPDCGKRHAVFGESHVEEAARRFNIEHIAKLPINPELVRLCDAGRVEEFKGEWLEEMFGVIERY